MKTDLYDKAELVPKPITPSQVSEKQLCSSIKETLAQGDYVVAISIMNELLIMHPNSWLDGWGQ